MGRVYRARMSVGEEAEVWHRWKRGESCPAIGRALDRPGGAVYAVVAAWGGIPPPPRTRARLSIDPMTGEEVSAAIAALLALSDETRDRLAQIVGTVPQ